MNKENQNIEWKSNWRDEYLKWICGFANANGGTLFIGVNDNGEAVGIDNAQKLLEDLPNKIRDILGILVSVDLKVVDGKDTIEIGIEAYHAPISYKGHFYFRSGSTNQELNGSALEKFILGKMGRKWDGLPATGFTMNDIDPAAIQLFRDKALKSKRIPENDINEPDVALINSLGLSSAGNLKNAAMIAFGRKPEKLVTGAYIKIGFFRTDTDLLFQDEVHGSLFHQVEKIMDLLLTKYTKASIAYEGLTRTETFDYPENALREAILNATVHKDYSSGNPIQISVYANWLMIWNAGNLPNGWTVETLTQKHISEPANPDIAQAFFRAGYIEAWGRGTMNIVKYCTDAGLPAPTFEDKWGGLAIVFTGTKSSEKTREKTGEKTMEKTMEKTRKKILGLMKEQPEITIQDLANQLNISQRAIEKQLAKLKESGIITRFGPNKNGHWVIIEQ